MARIEVGRGLNEYLSQLGNLEFHSDEIIGRTIYPAAGMVADAIDSAINTIPTRSPNGSEGLFADQKRGLHEGLGIAPKRNDSGYINVKIGFDGYNQHKTKTYPSGQPNAMIARAMESGTSFSKKQPFVGKTVRAVKARAEAMMQEELDKEISKVMEV